MKITFIFVLALTISGCANTAKYQPSDWYSGGYKDIQISDSEFKIYYSGNNSDLLTIQTYWLYRATNLTLEKGFDGFEILNVRPDPQSSLSTHYRVACPDLELFCFRSSSTPWIEAYATVRLIRGNIKPTPYRVFDARALKEKLAPIVDGKNCGDPGIALATSKVCPHDKGYLIMGQKNA